MSDPQDFDDLDPIEELPELEELEPLEAPEPMSLDDLEPVEEAPEPVAAAPEPEPEPAPEPAPEPEPEAPAIEEVAVAAAATAALTEEVTSEGDAPANDKPKPAVKKAGAKSDSEGGSRRSREPERPSKKPGEKRELEAAPMLLRKAATICLIGAIFPFYTALQEVVGIEWKYVLGAKAILLAGAWVMHQGALGTHGGKAVPALEKMAQANKWIPVGIMLALWIGAVVFALGAEKGWVIIAELGTLGLATSTLTHIWTYEHGGKFNPLFIIAFVGPAIAGVLNTIGAAGAFGVSGHNGVPIIGLGGSLAVGAGGILAVYTLFISMKEAKVQGEIKRQQMRDYKKAQREAQRAEREAAQAKGE